MNKEELKKELKLVLEEAKNLETKGELQFQTAEFLRKESKKLMTQSEDPTLTENQKEKLIKQMEALEKKLKFEIQLTESDIPKTLYLENKLESLMKRI